MSAPATRAGSVSAGALRRLLEDPIGHGYTKAAHDAPRSPWQRAVAGLAAVTPGSGFIAMDGAIWIGIGLSVGLMVVAMTGAIPAVAGALTQELVDLATILYALRALGGRPSGLTAAPVPHAASNVDARSST